MTNLREFIRSFEHSGIGEEELKIFYRSIRKSVILSYFDKRAISELLALEDKCQWPVLRRIADPKLSVYRKADKALLNAFINSIRAEEVLRAEKVGMDRDKYWSAMTVILRARIELFKDIFSFCRKDVRRCELVAARYRRARQLKIDDGKKLWKFGMGAGATALAGAAAIWYFSKGRQRSLDRTDREGRQSEAAGKQ